MNGFLPDDGLGYDLAALERAQARDRAEAAQPRPERRAVATRPTRPSRLRAFTARALAFLRPTRPAVKGGGS